MLVGSNAFFKDIKGFNSKDIDILELVGDTTNFKISKTIQIQRQMRILMEKNDSRKIYRSYTIKQHPYGDWQISYS